MEAGALLLAAKEGRWEVVEEALERDPEPLVRAADAAGHTLLHWASYHNRVAAASALVRAGAVVDARAYESRQTPLLWASRAGAADAAVVLLRGGADPSVADEQGLTPLLAATRGDHTLVAVLLLEAGANPNDRDGEGSTAAHWAAFRGA